MANISELFSATNVFLTNIVVAVSILLIGLILGALCKRVLVRGAEALGLQAVRFGSELPLEKIIASVAAYAIYAVTIVLAVERLGLTITVFYGLLLFAGIVVLVGLFAWLKYFIPNALAGFAVRKKCMRGQLLHAAGIGGTVVSVGITEVSMQKNKDVYRVPHMLLKKKLG